MKKIEWSYMSVIGDFLQGYTPTVCIAVHCADNSFHSQAPILVRANRQTDRPENITSFANVEGKNGRNSFLLFGDIYQSCTHIW